MKRVLMIAYHFPPLRGSSGIQRTLRFAKYLPEFGWQPIVLTIDPRAYEFVGDDQLQDVHPDVGVYRAPGLDTARQLSIRGRYPAFLARPDRWKSWWLGGVPMGLALVRKLRPDALWSTYPIATAHAIGNTLQRITRIPWIADFRDPMAQDGYPPDPRTWASFKKIEENVAARAARLVFTTPSARRTYDARYGSGTPERFVLIENGYDEETFPDTNVDAAPLDAATRTLLHSGIVYPDERDPSALIAALQQLKRSGTLKVHPLRVRFRAAVHDDLLRSLARKHDVEDMVEIAPPLPYRDAICEMTRADGLLVLQAANCNEQIPAKLYEYIRSGRPIVALTDAAGDTAATLRDAGFAGIAPLDDANAITRLLERYLASPGSFRAAEGQDVTRHSRRSRAGELAALLNAVTS